MTTSFIPGESREVRINRILTPLAGDLGARIASGMEGLSAEDGTELGRIAIQALSSLVSDTKGNASLFVLYSLLLAACESREDEKKVDDFFAKVYVNIPRMISSGVDLDAPHHLMLLPKLPKEEMEKRVLEIMEIIYHHAGG